jgi:hypothetical protein
MRLIQWCMLPLLVVVFLLQSNFASTICIHASSLIFWHKAISVFVFFFPLLFQKLIPPLLPGHVHLLAFTHVHPDTVTTTAHSLQGRRVLVASPWNERVRRYWY